MYRVILSKFSTPIPNFMLSDTCPETLALQGFLPFSMFFLHPFARCLRLRLMVEKKSNVTVYYSTKGLSFQHNFARALRSLRGRKKYPWPHGCGPVAVCPVQGPRSLPPSAERTQHSGAAFSGRPAFLLGSPLRQSVSGTQRGGFVVLL